VAALHGSEVLVERFIRGNEHRLLVVGGKVVAAARGSVAMVTGNGRSSVEELVEAHINTDPRRGSHEDAPLGLVETHKDEAVLLELQRQGLTPASVPAAGRQVLIQRNGNVSVDCTDLVHPEVAHVVSLAARVVGLDIAGVDLVAEDISKPLNQQSAAIVEVNAGPGLLMHLKPAEGAPRPVGRAIVDHLFAEHENGRIPVVGVAGSIGTQTVARLTAWLLHLSGLKVGLACREGLFLDSRRIDARPSASWEPAHRLLINRSVQAAVIENGAESILRDGLAYDRCAVGVVTDLAGFESLGEHDVTEPEHLLKVLRTQVDVVLPDGVAVLNADDTRIAALASLCDGQAILYGLDSQAAPLVTHRAEQGRVVLVNARGQVTLATGTAEVPLTTVSHLTGRRKLDASDAMASSILAAVGAAWALGISPDLIAAGLKTFEIDLPYLRSPQSAAA
jgi:cyanophycin synthetase